jgi:hypothetical protein
MRCEKSQRTNLPNVCTPLEYTFNLYLLWISLKNIINGNKTTAYLYVASYTLVDRLKRFRGTC